MIPMPKNDDHSDVFLGPLLDNFKDVKSDPRVQEHDNDALRLQEEKLRVACTSATAKDDGAVEAAAKNLRAAVQSMEPAMREVISEAIGKEGRTLEWVRVTTAGNSQFSKVHRSVFAHIAESTNSNPNAGTHANTNADPRALTLTLTLTPKVYRSVFEYIEESEEDGVQRYQEVIARLRAVLPGGKAPLQVNISLTFPTN